MLARRIACSGRYPVPCGRNPLASAYGFPLGKLVRYLAPAPAAIEGELPVDFRYCRQASCAAPDRQRARSATSAPPSGPQWLAARSCGSGWCLWPWWPWWRWWRWVRR